MKNIILAHGEDLDGIITHTLMDIYFRATYTNITPEHHFVRYDELTLPFERVLTRFREKREGSLLLVGDLSVNPPLVPLLKELSGYCAPEYFDHHTNTREHQAELEQSGITFYLDSGRCTSEIVAEQLLPPTFYMDQEYVRHLADLAHRSDFPLEKQQTVQGRKLEKVISFANAHRDVLMLSSLVQVIRQGIIFDGTEKLFFRAEEVVREYDQKEGEALRTLHNSHEVLDIEGYKVLFASASPLLDGKRVLHYLREEFAGEADLYVALYSSPQRNHLMIRSAGNPLEVGHLGQWLGGGGRGEGAGFAWPNAITPDNYLKEREMIIQRIGDYFRAKA